MNKTYTYLALGDSYTIGEGIRLQKSFPYQTVQLLRKAGHNLAAPEIVAKTGWTTEELQAGITKYLFAPRYDFVSLLIGVNNQYREQDIIRYKEQFEALLNRSIELAGGKRDHVFVLSIPDYSTTPFAKEKDTAKISREIDGYNKLSKAICIQYKIAYIDVAETNKELMAADGLVAKDGLHPSSKEYTKWAKMLAEAMAKAIKK